jgi:multicomponent Na+:H+ antiporter subunit B
MSHHLVIRVVSKLLIPFILMFGLYVQFHGDFGPGGGFQAGVIFASAFILYALVFGLDNARRVLPDSWVRAGVALGVLIFGGTGVVSLLLGGNYLDYSVLRPNPVDGQHLGILVIEFGIGLTVASVMVAIFFAFAGRGHKLDEMED